MILYSTFIAVTFGALATAISCISKSRMKTFIVLIGLTVTVFLGFMLFRGYMVGADVYDPYFSWCDVNYHMGNSLYHLRRYIEAMDAYNKALLLMPDYSEALRSLDNTRKIYDFLNNQSQPANQ